MCKHSCFVFLCSTENTVCAADDTKDPEKMRDEDLLKQVDHLPFCCLLSSMPPVD